MKDLLLVSVLAVFAASCAGTSAQKQQDDIAVLERAEELVGTMYRRDFGKAWDMMTPWLRQELSREVSKEGYVATLSKFFEQIKITDYDSSKLIVIGEKHAITQAEITHEFRERDETRTVNCERTLWLKFPDKWYWQDTALSCDYMLSAEEVERLTRNLR